MTKKLRFDEWLDLQLQHPGVSPAAVALLAETSAGYLSELRRGKKSEPSGKTVRAIARALALQLGKPESDLVREAFNARGLPVAEPLLPVGVLYGAGPTSRTPQISARPATPDPSAASEVIQEAHYADYSRGIICSLQVRKGSAAKRVATVSVVEIKGRAPGNLVFEIFPEFGGHPQSAAPLLINRTTHFELPAGVQCWFTIKEAKVRPEETAEGAELAMLVIPASANPLANDKAAAAKEGGSS